MAQFRGVASVNPPKSVPTAGHSHPIWGIYGIPLPEPRVAPERCGERPLSTAAVSDSAVMLNRPAPVLPHRPAHRPRLRLRTPVVWRTATTLQVGISDPLVLTHPDPAAAHVTARLVSGLDGSRAWSDLLEHDAVLLQLAHHGLLEDAAVAGPHTTPERRDRAHAEVQAWAAHWRTPDDHAAWTRRAQARVEVMGDGRLAVAIATLLAASGVGAVHVTRTARAPFAEVVTPYDVTPWGPSDVGTPRDQAVADLLDAARIHPGPRFRVDTPPSLVVVAHDALGPDTAMPAALTDDLVRRRMPHLPVVVSATRAQIGPWFLAPGDPCSRCLDLHRSDADPAWPSVAAHLARPRGRDGAAVPTVMAALAGAHAVLAVLTHVDAASHDRGEQWLLKSSDITRTHVDVHPQCGCDGRTLPVSLETVPTAVTRPLYPSHAHARRRTGARATAPTGTPAPTR